MLLLAEVTEDTHVVKHRKWPRLPLRRTRPIDVAKRHASEANRPASRLPDARELRLLHDLDAFDAKIKQAVSGLIGSHHGQRVIAWGIRRHYEAILSGRYAIEPLVNAVVTEFDERTDGLRRTELAANMVAAGVMAEGRPIRKFLSDARKDAAAKQLTTEEDFHNLRVAAEFPEEGIGGDDAEALLAEFQAEAMMDELTLMQVEMALRLEKISPKRRPK